MLLLAKARKIPGRKIYEVLLQNYLFSGYPSALISLKIFNEIFPLFKSKNKPITYSELKKRGSETCKKIYKDKYEKLIKNVNSFSPELAEWLVVEGYGKVLSRKHLSLKERELSIISVLTVLNFEDQLYSHIKGAIGLGIRKTLILDLFDSLIYLNDKSYSIFGRKVLKKL